MSDSIQVKEHTDEVYEIDRLNLLDCAQLCFQTEESGFLTLTADGKTYRKVILTRLVPFLSETEFISVAYETPEKEFREIGVIRDLTKLDKAQYTLLTHYLAFKYYMPLVTKVYSIRDNMRGEIFVTADTTSGKKTICIRDWYQNFRMLNASYLYINDADGNKYCCPEIAELDKKSMGVLEMFI
ncbi:MAG: DUF1854 domain-containing protein [Oscillospiraceae bacterium]